MSPPRQARLELDARLRRPLPRPQAEALVALLLGRPPVAPPPHPLFGQPAATLLLTGESLDHATTGSRILREAEGGDRLLASASLPPVPGLLEAGLDWLSGLLTAQAGAVLGYVVPPGSHRHDLRLLLWDGARLVVLPGLEATLLAEACSMASFCAAADLPQPERAEPDSLEEAMRRVALALLAHQALPVCQALLDGPFLDGPMLFRHWLALAAARSLGFRTGPAAHLDGGPDPGSDHRDAA